MFGIKTEQTAEEMPHLHNISDNLTPDFSCHFVALAMKNTLEKVQENAGNTKHKGVYFDAIKKYLCVNTI